MASPLQQRDVIVIGAGISGLVAARRLVEGGASVLVLEARDRPGGRTLTVPLGNGFGDLGGQWMTPTQDRLAALAEELGITAFEQNRDGHAIFARSAGSAGLPLAGALELAYRQRQIERLTRRVPGDAPETAPLARQWHSHSLADWLDAHVRTARARETLALVAGLHFAAEPDELSFLYFLHALGTTCGLSGRGLGSAAREKRFAGGAQSLAERLAGDLGDRVALGHAVTAIDHGDCGVTCTTAGTHERFSSSFAILALSPVLIAGIDITPALPAARRKAAASLRLAPVIKCAFAYSRPFWRDRRLSGEAYSTSGAVRAVVDHSAPDGSQPALLAFIVGDAARALSEREPAERRDICLAELVELFGDAAGKPVDHVAKDWLGDPWSPGCVAIVGPDPAAPAGEPELLPARSLRQPAGRLHMAGTETAERWPNYMDGAVEAGQRAAAEVLTRLRSQLAP